MPVRITELTLRGFRGATQPVIIRFDPDRPVVLLYGENGTGKSTIVDAVDFLCNRNFGSLENYSLGVGESARKHVTSLGGTPAALMVRLRADDGSSWTASLGRGRPLVDPEAGCPDAHILRRRDVTNVIEAPPSKRYDALKDYLTLPGVEKSEFTLRSAVRALERQHHADAQSFAHAQDTLQQLWQAEGQPAATARAWATAQAAQDLSEMRTSIDEMVAVETAYRSATEARDQLDRAASGFNQSSQAHGTAHQQRHQGSTRQAAELLELLRDAETFLGAWRAIRACPVCEQSIEAEVVHERLRQRIARAGELMSVIEASTAAEMQLTRSSAVLEDTRARFCERARALLRLIRRARLDEVLGTPLSWDSYMILSREGEATEVAETEARAALGSVVVLVQALSARRESAQRALSQHSAIRISAERVDALSGRVAHQRELLRRLETVLATISEERKRYAEDILEAVADDVGRLYASIHPDEPLGRVRFALKRQASSSIDLDAGFQDRDDLPPQAYYSESHLDTLGICVFLALARRFATDRSIVILDDVVTSVDEPHVDRFMEMLLCEARHFSRLIVTTHDRAWLEHFRHASEIGVIELGEWSLADGVRVAGPVATSKSD
jgi:energy-coupling factor transporter ATP-binding protein EcfA2